MAESTYRLAFEDGRQVAFDDEIVVMNPRSWDVHVLNAAAALTYEFLAAAPRSLSDIESLLADVLAEDQRHLAPDHAKRIVADLMDLGLVASD